MEKVYDHAELVLVVCILIIMIKFTLSYVFGKLKDELLELEQKVKKDDLNLSERIKKKEKSQKMFVRKINILETLHPEIKLKNVNDFGCAYKFEEYIEDIYFTLYPVKYITNINPYDEMKL